jgi:hypothetical protein
VTRSLPGWSETRGACNFAACGVDSTSIRRTCGEFAVDSTDCGEFGVGNLGAVISTQEPVLDDSFGVENGQTGF